jgi:hypothetical protein
MKRGKLSVEAIHFFHHPVGKIEYIAGFATNEPTYDLVVLSFPYIIRNQYAANSVIAPRHIT